MSAYRLADVGLLVEHLRGQRKLFAPLEQAGECHWLPLVEGARFHIGSGSRPLYSPKQFFFAEEEPVYAFEGGRFVQRSPEIAPRALIGVQACDLAAIAYMDRFFAADAHYRARRTATLLVGVDCSAPCEHGFCHLMDAGPAVREGQADLVLCHDGGAYLLLVGSDDGAEALDGLTLEPADPGWPQRRDRSERQVRGGVEDCTHVTAGMVALDAGAIAAETWEALGVQCLACSGCTLSCPTCSCFAPRARRTAEGAEHTRVWDSCLFEGFQREASGAHPAASPGMRVERYWFHKFGAPFRQQYGRATCVGCGRCEAVCPGSVGVHSVMKRLVNP